MPKQVVPSQPFSLLKLRRLTGWLSLVAALFACTGLSKAAPNISGFSPSAGAPGQSVTIFGSGFTGATHVLFGGSEAVAVFTVVNSNTITTTVPTNGLTGQISVTAGFTATSSGLFYVAPRVTGFDPPSRAIGTEIRIDGENFYPGTVTVTFNGIVNGTGLRVTAANQLFVNVPSAALTGPVIIGVNLGFTNLFGSGNTNFVVTGTGPVITSFTPSSGLPGTQILVEGGDFTGTTSVKINGTNLPAGTFAVTAPTLLYFTVPADATTGPVSITTPLGTVNSTSNFVVSGAPVVTSFSPAGGPTNSMVVLTGLRFIGATNVLFNGAGTTNFYITADTQIDVAVPTNATTGPVSVQNTFGTGASSASFTVGSAPSITNFAPAGGPAGTQVTIEGANFNNISAVRFNGSNANFTVTGAGVQLVATVPADAGTGPVSVETFFGTNTTSSNFLFGSAPIISSYSPFAGQTNTTITIHGGNFFAGNTVVKFNGLISSNAAVVAPDQISAPVPFGASTGPITIETPIGTNTTISNFFVTPRIESFNPTNGGAGDNVFITGLNFIGASSVRFNGAEASFLIHSNSALTAQVPTNTTTGPISVLTPAGIVTTTTNFAIAPKLFGFTPAAAPVGSSITITGAAFGAPISVTFNGLAAAAVTHDSLTQVRATVPANASSGPLRITTPDGTALSAVNFIVQPAITSFTPTNGGFGTVVTIDGTTLGAVTAVRFSGANASFNIVNSGRLTATVPAGAATGPIEVQTADALGSSSQIFVVGTAILGFSPTVGTAGDTVRIDGVGLDTVTSIEFNGAATAAFTSTSTNRLDVTIPIGATTGPIRVVSPDGSSQSSSNFTVLPKIVSFSPGSGGFAEAIVISGGGFTGVTNVQFNGTDAVFNVLGPLGIQAFVPATATTGPLRVNTPAGTALSAVNFNVVPPTIVGFNPPTAPVGASVVINGLSFGGTTNVTFNGVPASFVTNSFTQITATVPASASFGSLRVFTPAGVAVSVDNFGVQPVITGISPTSAAIGTFVTITGNGFLGVTNVQFSGVISTSFTVDHAGQITAQVPAVASPGPVRVQSPGGFSESAQEFQPLVPGINGFSPIQGGAGTLVTITGGNLGGITNVQINGIDAVIGTVAASQITVTVPLAATTGPIRARGVGTDFQTSSNFTVLPVITGFSPIEGNAGDSVVITGTLFTSATQVRFGNGTATQFTVNSATQITAIVPQTGTSGVIQVVTPGGTAVSTNAFSVFPALILIVPDHGPVGTVVDLRGVNFVGASSVLFAGSAIPFTIQSSTNITVTIPDGALTGNFRIITSQGNVDAATPFRVTPRIDVISPKGGLPGDQVLLIGSAFTGATNVFFSTNQNATSFVVSNYSVISVTVPNGATNGPVTVQTPSGDGASVFDFLIGAALRTGPTNTSQLVISWSTNATDYVLEFTTDLTTPINWQPFVGQGSSNNVVIDYTNPPRYFRLRKLAP